MLNVEAIRAVDAYRSPELIASLKNLTLGKKHPRSRMQVLLANQERGWFFLGWLGDELVGWVSVTKFEHGAKLLQVFVSPRHRRKGIAAGLVRYAAQFARKRIRRMLVCIPFDKQGREFFSKHCVIEHTPFKHYENLHRIRRVND
jgi:GNAT superfamily N-acetyltransferase